MYVCMYVYNVCVSILYAGMVLCPGKGSGHFHVAAY